MLQNIRVVLVNTSHPGNIGGAARAMKNMGLSRLVLVDPEDFPSSEAVARASGATDILDNAVVVATLEEALAGCSVALGTSARDRRIPWPLLDPRECATTALQQVELGGEVALVFGREYAGLTNDELQRCQFHVHIPSNPDFSSLNLAAAVQVLAYELRLALLAGSAPAAATGVPHDDGPATHAQMEGFFGQLGETLDEIDFHKGRTPDSAMRKLRRLFLKSSLNEQEVRLLRGILADAQRMAHLAGRKAD